MPKLIKCGIKNIFGYLEHPNNLDKMESIA